MKKDCPTDLQGRLIRCQQRAKLIADVLGFMDNRDAQPSTDALLGLGYAAEELADELADLETAYVNESNTLDAAARGGAR